MNWLKKKYDINSSENYNAVIIPDFSQCYGIVLIVGSSGSGKSTILRSLGHKDLALETDKPVIELFSSIDKGEELLLAFGLRTIPSWFRSITRISNGERHRAECALSVDRGDNTIDEFTSVVDRNTAKSLSASLRKYHENHKTIFIATCHRDVEPWLCPDFIYDTDLQGFVDRRYLRRPEIKLHIESSTVKDWAYFAKHHYLDSSMSKAVHSYTASIEGQKVAYLSLIHGCSRDIKTYWRECRLVVVPEWQGLGIGTTLSNAIAQEYINRGLRYFSKTAHPAMGEFRNSSSIWRATSTNGISRMSYLKSGKPREHPGFGHTTKLAIRDSGRVCYSHEYIGENNELATRPLPSRPLD